MSESFEQMLSGGHPNSLGRTEEVAQLVVQSPAKMQALFDTYDSDDEVVRLRVSSAFKRVFLAEPTRFKKWYPRFAKRVMRLGQPSALWTLALLSSRLEEQLTPKNKRHATESLKEMLDTCDDWIVINHALEALGKWSMNDAALKRWLRPRAEAYMADRRKSVARRAAKLLRNL